MYNKFYFALTFITALGSGIAGGVFFAFSSFVMKGLSRLNHDQGIKAMQAINITAVTPLFMSALFGTALACVILIVMSLAQPTTSGTYLILSGCIFYIVGIVLVTGIFNVPLNNELAAVNPSTAAGTEVWIKYLNRWVAWNHIRFLAGLASSAFLILGLIRYSQVR